MPTKKWFATQITALTGWFIAFVTADFKWTTTVIIALATIGSQAAIGWLVPNDKTPGGVPARKRRRRVHREHGYGVIELLFAILLVVVIVWLIVYFASRI